MNLLYKHISNIPNYEILRCLFIVDDNVYYVATIDKDKDDEYRLYSVSNYKITKFMGKASMISEFDMIICKNLPPIIEQCAYFEEELRIVKYKTYRKESKNNQKPKEIITRDVHNRFKKLF
jgi:hypothetical protein